MPYLEVVPSSFPCQSRQPIECNPSASKLEQMLPKTPTSEKIIAQISSKINEENEKNDNAFLEDRCILAQEFPILMRVSNDKLPIEFQERGDSGELDIFTLEIATYSFHNDKGNEMFFIILLNDKQLTLLSSAVERILKEKSTHIKHNPSSDFEKDIDANESSLSDDSFTSEDGENDNCGTRSNKDDVRAAL